MKLQDEIDQTKYIFIAKIKTASVVKEDEDGFATQFEATFDVLKEIKGMASDVSKIRTDSFSNFKFVPGFRYLVFTNDGEVGGCINSTSYSSFPMYTEADEFMIKSIELYIKVGEPIDHEKLFDLYSEYYKLHADDQL